MLPNATGYGNIHCIRLHRTDSISRTMNTLSTLPTNSWQWQVVTPLIPVTVVIVIVFVCPESPQLQRRREVKGWPNFLPPMRSTSALRITTGSENSPVDSEWRSSDEYQSSYPHSRRKQDTAGDMRIRPVSPTNVKDIREPAAAFPPLAWLVSPIEGIKSPTKASRSLVVSSIQMHACRGRNLDVLSAARHCEFVDVL